MDERDFIHPGPHPGALRDVLGLTVEEFTPLRKDEHVRLTNGITGDVWSEALTLTGAEPVWSYLDGPNAGRPAVTRHSAGDGEAWYVSTRLAQDGLDAVLARAITSTTLRTRDLPRDIEVVERVGSEGRYLFAINHTDEDAMIPLGERGTELLTGQDTDGHIHVPAGEVRVVLMFDSS